MDSPSPRRYQDKTPQQHHHHHNSPNSSTSSTNSNGLHQQMPPTPTTPTSLGPGIPAPPAYQPQRNLGRSESGSPYPTTFVQADSSSFKQVVQMLTGCTETARQASSAYNAIIKDQHSSKNSHNHNHIPAMKTIPNKKHQHQQSSGFKLYERRNNLNLNPLLPAVFSKNSNSNSNNVGGVGSPRFSPRNRHEVLSPSILDFPSLVLSPVTPLIPDPFGRSSSAAATPSAAGFNNSGNGGGARPPILDAEAEERAIKEKGFYLHPSPANTPRDAEPCLLPLFPTASPRASAARSSSSA